MDPMPSPVTIVRMFAVDTGWPRIRWGENEVMTVKERTNTGEIEKADNIMREIWTVIFQAVDTQDNSYN